jgi:stage V sporulation protein SpoVS
MNRIAKLACGLLLCTLAVSCGGSTSMIGMWSDPTYQSEPVDKVLVVGLAENPTNVRIFESAMAKQLKARKITAIPGTSVFPDNAPIDTTVGRKYCVENGVDLVTITRVVGVSKETEYVPGTAYYTPAPAYYGFYPYYYSSYSMVSTPGYMREYTVGTVETNVYSLKSEKLVWSGQSQTVDPSSVNQAIDDFAIIFVGEMAKSGIFGKK